MLLFLAWPLDQVHQITIKKGASTIQIADQLEEEGVIPDATRLLVSMRILGLSRKLQAGSYVFRDRLSNYSLIQMLHRGKVELTRITFPEGMTIQNMAALIDSALGIPSVDFIDKTRDPEFIRSLGLEAESLEGYLFPDTYFLPQFTTAEELIRILVAQFNAEYTDSLILRTEQTGQTVHDVLTLASIVEGEAILDEERPTIASLYINRLRIGMPLQADPTIQFIIHNGPRRLLKEDLDIDSPYNTYRNRGLPPGPVNNPGLASILAVLYPDTTHYLYMVANGDGSHTFSTNIEQHIQAKKRFDRIRRYVRRQAYLKQ